MPEKRKQSTMAEESASNMRKKRKKKDNEILETEEASTEIGQLGNMPH